MKILKNHVDIRTDQLLCKIKLALLLINTKKLIIHYFSNAFLNFSSIISQINDNDFNPSFIILSFVSLAVYNLKFILFSLGCGKL